MGLPIKVGERYVIQAIGDASNLWWERDHFIGKIGTVKALLERTPTRRSIDGYHSVYIEVEDFTLPRAEWPSRVKMNHREEYTGENPVFQCTWMKLGPLPLEAEDLEYDQYDQEELET